MFGVYHTYCGSALFCTSVASWEALTILASRVGSSLTLLKEMNGLCLRKYRLSGLMHMDFDDSGGSSMYAFQLMPFASSRSTRFVASTSWQVSSFTLKVEPPIDAM